MMKVIGEEGTSTQDFVDYLKGEFFDDVYLQQNAFDKVDEATSANRQKHAFSFIKDVIEKELHFETKEQARKFFQGLRQRFITWNSTSFKTGEFDSIEKELRKKLNNKGGPGHA
ncbi:unnamed protein product [marine sediment metagenome]|uniref:Uncharacterized protein n=1 Tax=marine sediment metagenome TaxID=412755 RepID=X0S0C1_9ZZZZ